MYDKELIQKIISDARVIVDKNRKKYDELMRIIEHFISENDIIVKNCTMYFFDLFVPDMIIPRKLTKLLYDSDPVLAKYVTLDTKIKYYNSKILINGITFVNFTYVNKEIKGNVLKYFCTLPHTNIKSKCIGPEISLIGIYGDLINPSMYKEWNSLLQKEEILSKEIVTNLKDRIVTGESEYNKKLLTHYISDHHVVIGNYATNYYTSDVPFNRLQVITSKPFSEEIKELRGIFGQISYSINNLRIPINLNLHKMIIFYDKQPIIDIFDAGNYELISYIEHNNIKIGSPFVILRFRLIDIWYLLYSKSNANIVNFLIYEYKKMKSMKFTIEQLFPCRYEGYYEDQQLIKQRIAAKLKIGYIKPYSPYLEKFDT